MGSYFIALRVFYVSIFQSDSSPFDNLSKYMEKLGALDAFV